MPTVGFADLGVETREDLVSRLDPLTPGDREIIEKEIKSSPATAAMIQQFMDSGGPHAVADFARRAFANEMDSKLFPETKGYWPELRATVQKLLVALPNAMRQAANEMSLDDKLKFAEQIAAGKKLRLQLADYPVETLMGLGQFEIIGSIVSSVAGAASSVYSAKVVADAKKAIAKIQAETELKQLNVSMTLAKAQAAVQGAQGKILEDVQSGKIPAEPGGAITATGPSGSVTATVKEPGGILNTKVAGLPLWSIGLTAVGGLVLAFK